MFFISKYQAQKLAEAAINEEFDIKFLKNILKNTPSIDIALFGRMLAADPSLGEDASAQVAHAISTHAIQNEFDYYTAVDDLAPEDNAGAGMLGTIEFNSSTLYRYANIAVHELLKQLEKPDVVINTVKLFIEAFSNSLPTGKINTFAHQTLPQVLLITLRNDRPVNLVSAFEQPVKSTIGYIEKSIERLSQEFKRVEKFVNKPVLTMYVSFDRVAELQKIGEEKDSLHALLHDFALMLNQLIQPQEGD